jgi:hypothetical protein
MSGHPAGIRNRAILASNFACASVFTNSRRVYRSAACFAIEPARRPSRTGRNYKNAIEYTLARIIIAGSSANYTRGVDWLRLARHGPRLRPVLQRSSRLERQRSRLLPPVGGRNAPPVSGVSQATAPRAARILGLASQSSRSSLKIRRHSRQRQSKTKKPADVYTPAGLQSSRSLHSKDYCCCWEPVAFESTGT